jgi:hypothetical protein
MILTVVLGIFTVIAVIDGISAAVVRKAAQRQAALLYRQAAVAAGPLPDFEKVPEALRAYMHASKIYEQPHAGSVLRLRQKGAIRFREGQGWKPFEAKCFIALQSVPGLVWYADVTMGWLRSRAVLHILSKGIARWQEKIWGLNVHRGFSSDWDIRTHLLTEYYATAVWHPVTWIGPALVWEVSGERTLLARTPNPDLSLSLTLRFGPDALLESLTAERGTSTWTVRYSEYREVGGVVVPLAWMIELSRQGRKWVYLEGKVTDMVSDEAFSWW